MIERHGLVLVPEVYGHGKVESILNGAFGGGGGGRKPHGVAYICTVFRRIVEMKIKNRALMAHALTQKLAKNK